MSAVDGEWAPSSDRAADLLQVVVILFVDGILGYITFILEQSGKTDYAIALIVVLVTTTLSFLASRELKQPSLNRQIGKVYKAVVANQVWVDSIINCTDEGGRKRLLSLFEEIRLKHRNSAECYLTWSGNYQDVTNYSTYFLEERDALLARSGDPSRRIRIFRIVAVGPNMVKASDFDSHRSIMASAELAQVYDYVRTGDTLYFDLAYCLEVREGVETHKAAVVFLDSNRRPQTLSLFFDGSVNDYMNRQAKEVGRILKEQYEVFKRRRPTP